MTYRFDLLRMNKSKTNNYTTSVDFLKIFKLAPNFSFVIQFTFIGISVT